MANDSATVTGSAQVLTFEIGTAFSLHEEDALWDVQAGRVDVFVVPADAGLYGGPRRHLWSAGAGSSIVGFPEVGDRPIQLVGVAIGGTCLVRHSLAEPPARDDLLPLYDAFVDGIAKGLDEGSRAPAEVRLKANRLAEMTAGQRATADDEPVWIDVTEGVVGFLGDPALPLDEERGVVPIGRGLWVRALDGSASVVGASARTVAEDQGDDPVIGIRNLQDLLTLWAALRAVREAEAERIRLAKKASTDADTRSHGLAQLTTLLGAEIGEKTPPGAEGDILYKAMRIVGKDAGIDFKPAPRWESERHQSDKLGAICRTSRVRYRQVGLRGEWWTHDAGPMLAYRQGEDDVPVALLWTRDNCYEWVDPVEETRTPMTPELSKKLEPIAFTFYARPGDGIITGKSMLDIGFRGLGREIWSIFGFALAGALIGLLVPITTDHMFDSVIPAAVVNNALLLGASLAAVHVGALFFEAARAFAILRVEGKGHGILQAAFVDRLLALPVPFYRSYTVGDMADRVGAVNALRELGGAAAVNAILGGVTSVVYLALLTYYSWKLALLALLIVLVSGTFTVFVGSRAVRLTREAQKMEGSISGLVFQLLSGVDKLRVSGAEGRGFARWCAQFTRQKSFAFKAGHRENVIEIYNDVLPLLAAGLLFFFVGRADEPLLATARFVAFNSAFGTFFRSATALSDTIVLMLAAVPIMERAQPILRALPESPATLGDPGELTGRIEVVGVSFRYKEDGPLILDNVSVDMMPGDFVAFVGPSGSGKSTLLRLLLGFEVPEAGSVTYDGQDMQNTDVTAVRAQLGVVLQSSRVSAGTILENIIGSSPLSVDDAWEAAEMAGFLEDVRSMPMGLYTVVSEGGTTLSGGQRQRLLIARALVQKPRILLFDEATSALDNRTQEVVSKALDETAATRVVIAHRLSTIRNADKIYVMKAGKIVQAGSFEALMEEEGGLFQDLIRRQMV